MRVLIVDDDPISLRFLQAALQQLDCTTVGAGNVAAALATASTSTVDLLLLDRNLPDGSGNELLATLRRRGCTCPAIATSAEFTAQTRAQLRAAGFTDCIEKPVTQARLQEILRPWLDRAEVAPLDDAAALAAVGGDGPTLKALRSMLAKEVSTLHEDVAHGGIDTQTLLERLHRLRASCGFCGARKLADAAVALEQALRADVGTQEQRQRFATCCLEAIDALAV
jgi:CheY-like chemotaxis protein